MEISSSVTKIRDKYLAVEGCNTFLARSKGQIMRIGQFLDELERPFPPTAASI